MWGWDREKSAQRITVWHHKACWVITNGDHEGQIFLSHPHTNNGLFFLHTIKYNIFIFKSSWIQLGATYFNEVTLTCWIAYDVTCLSTCGCSIFIFPTGWYRVCEIEFSRPLIAQDKLFHRQNTVLNFLIPSTWPAYPVHMTCLSHPRDFKV